MGKMARVLCSLAAFLSARPALAASAGMPTAPTCQGPADSAWTVMVFLNGDNSLEHDTLVHFNEIAATIRGPKVNVVVQYDRSGDYARLPGEPNWTQTLRFQMRPGVTASVEDSCDPQLGELDMGDPKVLKDFVEWSMGAFPAKHYALIICSHGSGWSEMRLRMQTVIDTRMQQLLHQSTASPGLSLNLSAIVLDDHPGPDHTGIDYLTSSEVARALTGKTLDLLGFDACLMGMIETAYAVSHVAQVFVASQLEEENTGWAYSGWLKRLDKHPEMTGGELGDELVGSYRDKYKKSTDRALVAVDLRKFKAAMAPLEGFARALIDSMDDPVQREVIHDARLAQSDYANAPTHADLIQFAAEIAKRAPDGALRYLAEATAKSLRQAVRKHFAGSNVNRTNGLAIYFPASGQAASIDVEGAGAYAGIALDANLDFVTDVSWSQFMDKYTATFAAARP